MTGSPNLWWCVCGQTTRRGPLTGHVYAPCCKAATWWSHPPDRR